MPGSGLGQKEGQMHKYRATNPLGDGAGGSAPLTPVAMNATQIQAIKLTAIRNMTSFDPFA